MHAYHICASHCLQEPFESAPFSGNTRAIRQVGAQRGWEAALGHTARLGKREPVSSFQSISVEQTVPRVPLFGENPPVGQRAGGWCGAGLVPLALLLPGLEH